MSWRVQPSLTPRRDCFHIRPVGLWSLRINPPVALKRRARVLAGRFLPTRLPARTRALRWLQLILKDHKPTAKFKAPLRGGRETCKGRWKKDAKKLMTDLKSTTRFRFWLWLIRVIGVIVPRRLRAG